MVGKRSRTRVLGREVFVDAEHFFDGFLHDPDYTTSVLLAAQAGAGVLVL